MKAVARWVTITATVLLIILAPFFAFQHTLVDFVGGIWSVTAKPELLFGLAVLLLAADPLLPIPSSLVNTWAGVVLGFSVGTLACWLGMTLGAVLAYWLASWAGTPVVRRFIGDLEFRRAASFTAQHGLVALAVLRPVPVLAEASVIWAGVAGVPFKSFVVITSLANIGVSAAYSAVGAFAMEMNSFLLAFGGAVAIPAMTMFAARSGASRFAKSQSSTECPLEDRSKQAFAAQYTYEVYFTQSVFDPCNTALAKSVTRLEPARCHSLTVFIDDGVAASWPDLTSKIEAYVSAHAQHLQLSDVPMVVPGGERCKNDPEIVQTLYRHLHSGHVDRHSFVVAIGGGAVLDAVGFVAATTHRGLRLVRIPTTVLAQNDSGVGVKNGINFFEKKNFVGTFAPPFVVINDIDFIATLEPRDCVAGMAEAVKVGLIRDGSFFAWLESNADTLALFDRSAMATMIRRCAELHMHQIAHGGDPFEMGSARPLDYGHWVAHKLETLSGYHLRHGEAVAIGIALDSRYSVLSGLLEPGEEERICCLLDRLGFKLWHSALEQTTRAGRPAVLLGLQDFREHLGGELTVTLLTRVGTGIEVHEMDERLILDAVEWLRRRGTS